MQRRHRRRHVMIWAFLLPAVAGGLFLALAGRTPPVMEPVSAINPLLAPGG